MQKLTVRYYSETYPRDKKRLQNSIVCGALISRLEQRTFFRCEKIAVFKEPTIMLWRSRNNPEGKVGASIIKWDAPPNVDRGYFHMGWQLFVIMMLRTSRLVNKRLPTLGGALHIMTSRLVGASNHPAT